MPSNGITSTVLPPELQEFRSLSTTEAAEIVGLAPRTLENLRGRGEGPRWLKLGRAVGYRLVDVIAWRDAHLVGGASA
ncbi:helix-turn-helix transcriptional regulator [Corynebacterium nasicanis]